MYNECRHIMPSGIRCHAPALRETHFCYFHTNLHRVTAPKTKFDDWSLKLPVLEDRRAIQMALTQVLGELAAGRLDPRRAGLLLYGLQIATKVAARTSMVFLNPVRSLSYEGEDVLAPEKTVCEPPQDCRNCPKSETCDNFMEMTTMRTRTKNSCPAQLPLCLINWRAARRIMAHPITVRTTPLSHSSRRPAPRRRQMPGRSGNPAAGAIGAKSTPPTAFVRNHPRFCRTASGFRAARSFVPTRISRGTAISVSANTKIDPAINSMRPCRRSSNSSFAATNANMA